MNEMNVKYKMGKWLLALSVIFLSCQLSFAQSVSVEARIDSAQRVIGEQAKITVKVTCDANKKILFPNFKDTVAHKVDLVEVHPLQVNYLNNNQRKEVKCDYIVSSIDSGLYYIPPFTVLVDGVKYRTQPLSLKVYTMPVDLKHPNKFFPPKDVMKPPFVWADWAGLVYCSFLVIIFVVILVYFWLRLRDNKPILHRMKILSFIPPDKKALQQIEQLKSGRAVEQEQQKEYYTALTDALRTYIKDRFGFNAMEMTSSEIIEKLMSLKEDNDTFNDLKMLFETADLVKFAKHAPMLNENDNNLVNAVSFINGTRLQEVAVKKVVPEYTVEEKRSRKSRMALICGISVLALSFALILTHIVLRVIDLI